MPNDHKFAVEKKFRCIAKKIEGRTISLELHGELFARHIETYQLTNYSDSKKAFVWEAFGDGRKQELKFTVIPQSDKIRTAEDALNKAVDDFFQSL